MVNNQIPNEEKSSAEFDEYRDSYTSQISESLAFSGQPHDFFTKVKADCLAQILIDNALSDIEANVLDVGCGHGLIHPHLLALNGEKLKLSGVDIAPAVIEMARTNNPAVSYQCYDGIKLPYPENSFDVAFAICVMHHVPPKNWLDFLHEMKKVVKPGGLVVIFEHNPLNPLTLKIVKNCPLDKNAVLLSSRRMRRLMREVGLNKVSNNFILFTPFEKSFFQKLDRRLSWLPFGAQYYTLARKMDNLV